MNLTDITTSIRASSLLNGQVSSVAATTKTASADPIAKAFAQAEKRVQQQLDVTSARLSSFGKLKSAFVDVQSAAKTLSSPKAGATDADISKAASDFVNAFNTALKATQTSQTQATSTQEISGARRAQVDLRRALGSDSSLSNRLKGIGITSQADGSLSLDASKFQAATQANATDLRASLAQLGEQGQAVATRELADSGSLGSTLKALGNQSSSLKARQSAQQAALASFQQFANAQNAVSSTSSGLNTYNNLYRSYM